MSSLIECKSCNAPVSKEAKACPKCGAPVRKKWGFWKIFGLFWLFLIIVGVFQNGEGRGSRGSSGSPSRGDSKAATPAVPMPASQREFVATVSKARKDADGASNDMARGGILAERTDALKGIHLEVDGWIGKVAEVDSNSDGKGILSIEIARGVYVKTWNNSLSDLGDNTLLDPGSAVFKAAAKMRKGQAVKFSGSFFRDDDQGIREQSVSLRGKLEEPEFLFRFRSIQAL